MLDLERSIDKDLSYYDLLPSQRTLLKMKGVNDSRSLETKGFSIDRHFTYLSEALVQRSDIGHLLEKEFLIPSQKDQELGYGTRVTTDLGRVVSSLMKYTHTADQNILDSNYIRIAGIVEHQTVDKKNGVIDTYRSRVETPFGYVEEAPNDSRMTTLELSIDHSYTSKGMYSFNTHHLLRVYTDTFESRLPVWEMAVQDGFSDIEPTNSYHTLFLQRPQPFVNEKVAKSAIGALGRLLALREFEEQKTSQ